MSLLYLTDSRTTIPRWRNYDLSTRSGEVSPIKALTTSLEFSISSLREQIQSWKKYQTIGHASDLFSSAYTLGIEKEFLDVAEFLKEHDENISEVLKRLVESSLTTEFGVLSASLIQIDFFSDAGRDRTIAELSKIKGYLKREPKNPLAWIEYARNHSLLGNVEKSIDAVNTALHVNEMDNRFILRSAARFFHHLGDDEKSHGIIRRSKYVKHDPWLLSSEIAFSSVLGRKSSLLKTAKEIIDFKSISPFHISELASALGTIELGQGDFKKARKYFNTALINPNDNALAQVVWYNDVLGVDISEKNINIPLAFEAQTQSNYIHQRYNEARESAIRWLNDEPYSTRPVRLASYISTIFLEDRETSIAILKHGLKVNPSDINLLNSLCYNLLLDSRTKEAESYFSKLKIRTFETANVDMQRTMLATAGLYFFRNGEINVGRKYYQDTIEHFGRQKNDYLLAIATANYVREEIEILKNRNVTADKVIIQNQLNILDNLSNKLSKADVSKMNEKAVEQYSKLR